jgi:hypothetical protein
MTIRDNARLAEKERHDAEEEKIRVAVEIERSRWIEHKSDESERIVRLTQIADEWRDIAQQRDIKNKLQSEQLSEVNAKLTELQEKYDALLNLYTDSQRRLADLEKTVNGKN